MAYKGALQVDDETLFRTMEVASVTGALVMVHAENGDAIDVLVEAGARERPDRAALARAHAPARDRRARRRTAPSSWRASPAARCTSSTSRARSRSSRSRSRAQKGWDVWGETCTQYFFVDYTFLERPNFEGAKYVYTPPPRDKANQEVLWDAVRTDVLSAISTDHCAFNWDGQKTLGRTTSRRSRTAAPGSRTGCR